MEDPIKQRLAELEARAPAKRKKQQPFVKVPLGPAAKAATASGCQRMMVWLYLLHRGWKLQKASFAVPSGALRSFGISKEVKRRALRNFEAAGLITVERRTSKNPIVTLVDSVYG
jgi:hypothetical protein